MTEQDSLVTALVLDLPRPHLGDNRAHEARVRAAIEQRIGSRPNIPISTLRLLGTSLDKWEYGLKAILTYVPYGWELADVGPKHTEKTPLCLGIDLGSTSVVFYLLDPITDKLIETYSLPNPQRKHGEDILDRILFAGRNQGLQRLQLEIVDLINKALHKLTMAHGASPEDIYYIAVAGNTTMSHFLLALDPQHICREPYIPAANRIDPLRPSEIGITANPNAWLYCFPNVGSYFGGDLIAGILASGMHRRPEISLLVDVGTNAEVILGNQDWLVACAGAAGPALEGGILSCGMQAQKGAIERVHINPDTLELTYKTIGNTPPRGLCGSGIIDLLAAMFEVGIVDQTGKLVLEKDPSRMLDINGEWAYVVAHPDQTQDGRPVYISQSDIKNLIRSKGAMYTILNVVLQSVGIGFDDIERFYVAGAFGNYIDPKRAITIGMLPDIPIERFTALGNAAGKGTIELLKRRQALNEIEQICDMITYLEMNVRGDFMNQLTGALFLPHTDLSRFPNVAKRLGLS